MINIRPYTPSDKEQLIALLRLNTPAYFDTTEEAGFITYLDNELEDYFVVEEGNSIIGSGGINYEDNHQTAIISWDIIHPKHQGKGIGKKLITHRINKIKENLKTNLIVVRTSQLTDKFYEKMGFDLEFVKKDYWAKGFDLYQMTHNLS